MKRLIHQLVLGFFAALCVAGCSAEVVEDKDFGRSTQAQVQTCMPMVYDSWETPVVGAPGLKTFSVKTMNGGTSSCSWRISLDLHNGSALYSTPVIGPYTLAPYSGSGPTMTTSQPAPVTGSCSYDVWYKYKPCSTCAEAWFVDLGGPFWC